ncbi:acyltransferase 3 [Fibrisoma limi BUZ 3]|uniref:Acyltransferase 3 n=1 Tax=Fibrisoma limi BUZ 3 TaxID=1185876 RepID=I2GEI2_9BACT|nr:acyltransferase [Fibrisoma limi]CCH52307.1 acyltransferase 3 [Fibrisoma limi BUZ 3]
MNRSYLTTLTPMRGIAAVLVVIFHFNLLVLPIIDPAITQLHRRWYLLVDFFFILSGFIITYVYGDWFENRVTVTSFRRYMAARFARIYPLHFVTLLWVIALYILVVPVYHVKLSPVEQGVFDVPAIPLHVFMLHGFLSVSSATWNTPTWSIGCEWLLYLLFPVLMLGFRRLSGAGRYAMLGVVLALYVYLTQPVENHPMYKPWLPTLTNTIDDLRFPGSFLRCFAGFLLGMISLEAYTRRWGQHVLGRSAVFTTLVLGLAVCFHLQILDTLTVWAFPLLILGACYNAGRVSKLLESRPLQRLGDWSYSIYMVHMPILFSFLAVQLITAPADKKPAEPVTYGPAGPIACGIYLALVIAVAALMHRFVEVPGRRFFNRSLKAKQSVEPEVSFS